MEKQEDRANIVQKVTILEAQVSVSAIHYYTNLTSSTAVSSVSSTATAVASSLRKRATQKPARSTRIRGRIATGSIRYIELEP